MASTSGAWSHGWRPRSRKVRSPTVRLATKAARLVTELTELTDHIDLGGWPPGTRRIVRREPFHAGGQTSLFPSVEYRYWGHYTDQAGDPVDRDVHMRA